MDTAVDGIEIYAPQLTTLINVRSLDGGTSVHGVYLGDVPQQLNSSKQQLRVQQAALYPIVEVCAATRS